MAGPDEPNGRPGHHDDHHDGSDGDDSDARPPYHEFLQEIYQRAVLAGEKPVVTTDPARLQEQARQAMKPEAFNYVFGGAGEQDTMHANRLAFAQWRIVPRFLRPTMPRDLRVTLFGQTYDCPVLMAPVGVQGVFHPDGEIGVATACADLGVPYVLSTASTTSLEDLARALPATPISSGGSNSSNPRWFQLYWPRDDELTASLLRRARAAGCTALVVTLDTFTIGWRPLDLDAGYLPMATGAGNAIGFSDPVFRARFAEQMDGSDDVDADIKANVVQASSLWLRETFPGQSRAWADLATLRRLWGADRPMLLKGVLSADDARLARQHGVDGVIVSNHGGRQLDGAVAALDALPEVVDAVGRHMPVLFDSGIRTGADVIKALALGASAVLVGRPVIYGLGIAGTDGAKQVLAGLLADLDVSMGLAGAQSLRDLNRDMLRKVTYGGGHGLSNL